MHELRKKLTRKPQFNPFSDSYDGDLVMQELKDYIEKTDENDYNIKLVQTCIATEHLNHQFKDTYAYLKKTLFKSNLTVEEVIKYSMAHFNRQYLIINSIMIESLSGRTEIKYNEAYGHKLPSMDSTIGQVDTVLALEGMVDALNLLCTYTRFFSDSIPEKQHDFDDIKSIEAIKRLNVASNYLDIMKGEYDNCVWNDGYLDHEFNSRRIDFRYIEQSNLFLKKIGFYRMQKNVSGFNYIMKERFDNDKVFEQTVVAHFRKNRNPKRIKSVSVDDGYINYKLSSGENKEELEDEFRVHNEFAVYYDFLEDVKLPQLSNMSLTDVIKLFCLMQRLIREVVHLELGDDSVFQLVEWGKFPYRIKVENLKLYLVQRTIYSKKQVNEFLNLLTNPKDQRINFWDYPLWRMQDDYLLPLLSLSSPITTVLADRWLEDGGFNLDERGKLFENYIKNTLKEDLTKKGFFFRIPNNSILTNSRNEWEEIDLLVNLKNICLIAEVKCIKFALDARNEHNAIKRLQKGAEQVIRKAQFVEDNTDDLSESIGDIKQKKIVRAVITNYPIYSGYVLNGIPVIDFFMLEAYVSTGKLSNQRQTIESGKFTKREVISEKILYHSEDEFCNNLESFLGKPPQVYENMDFFQMAENKITPEFMELQMFVEAVDYK